MDEALQFDISGAIAVALAVTQFDWSWTACDLDRAVTQMDWSRAERDRLRPVLIIRDTRTIDPAPQGVLVSRSGARIDVDEDGCFDNILIDVADTVGDHDDYRGAVTVFDRLLTHFESAWGDPLDGTDIEMIRARWIFPQVVFSLEHRFHSVFFRLTSPAAYETESAAHRAYEERKALRTDYSKFLEVLPHVIHTQFGTWSRADIDRLLSAVGWANEDDSVSGGDITAGLDSDTMAISIRASRTEEYVAEPPRWGFGEFRRISLLQYLSEKTTPAAYAAALRACVELLGPPPRVGGPYACAIWRGPEVTITLSRIGLTRLDFTVTASEPEEEYEHWCAEWSERWRPEDCWLVAPNAEGTRFSTSPWGHWEPAVESWAELDDYIDNLVSSLVLDLPLLHPYATEIVWALSVPGERSVQCWFSATDIRVGTWRPGQSDWTLTSYPVDGKSSRRIAKEIKAAVRNLNVAAPEDLQLHAASRPEPQRLSSIRLGFVH
ncbi:DUF6301 family protein [Nocardia sp. NBC_01388]|uniref:DUF6301 family protein n=1 Tax=Nocardia sp. NBC_01388 TaxID=2903596 RepID=UPI00324F120B